MKINKSPEEIWSEYQKGVDYKRAIELYDTVEENEDFFIGKQWEGVNAPDLQKPVLNIIQRAVAYFVSTICSDDIGTQLTAFHADEATDRLMRTISMDIERIMENDQTKAKFRDSVRNAAVDGDGCMYFYFDPEIRTGQAAEGDIRSEVIENINMIFGNPYEQDAQRQPYIIIALRKPVDEVQDEARGHGVEDYEAITPDSDENQGEKGTGNELCTVLVKMWKEQGKLHAIKTTKTSLVRGEWTTGSHLYPIAWMSWNKVRKSYHGQASVTGLIPNQITINKLFAMLIRSVELNAFPKVVYDLHKFGKDGWNNRVGEAIGIMGDPSQAAINVLRGGDVSPQVMEVIQTCITLTKDCIGATDAALGNVRAENAAASAIIATQQASAAPLELQHRAFFDFVEQAVRIILDLMGTYYGTRRVMTEQGQQAFDAQEVETVDYSVINHMIQKIEVSIGSSAYWSELMQMQTMDNLLRTGLIQDAVLYLESIPDKWLPNKQKIIDGVQKTQQMQDGQMELMEDVGLAGDMEQMQDGQASYEDILN